MKKLSDNTEVPARGYYYLLDWNEMDGWKFMVENIKKNRLCDLNIAEYKILFAHATNNEFINENRKTN